MKKKRFYKNVKRNQKWTEEPQGREIDFADKYADNGIYSDKFDYMRPKQKKKKRINVKKAREVLKKLGIAVLCLAIVGVGYTAMDVYMLRHKMPDISSIDDNPSQSLFNEVVFNLHADYIESVSLDGSVMLDAVLAQTEEFGRNSVAFDLKRSEGSIGYRSALSNIDAYGAIAFPASNLKASAETLAQNDILAVGVVYCYLDNLVPVADSSMAVMDSNGIQYRDSRDNTYLNPNSENVYKYIKDIIAEAYEMGISIFVLCGTELPDDISDHYNDGFEYIAGRLYGDIGSDIKLLSAIPVRLSSSALDDDSDEITQKLGNELDGNHIYYITMAEDTDKDSVIEKLEDSGISNYILAD